MHTNMFSISYHLFLILSLTLLLPAFSDLDADRFALLGLRAAVGGQTLQWNTSAGSSPCSPRWRGVTCNVTTNRVIELRLPGARLMGQLPLNCIGNLTELRALSLRNNALSGQLPSDLAACTHLEDVHLQGNGFSGGIPENFFTLTNLLRVNFAGNNFSGDLSPEFNKLTELRTLYIENNNFSGSFPNWDSLTNLINFNVSFNGLITGSIPSSLGTFSDQSFLGINLCGRPLASCSSSDGNKLSGGALAGIVVGSFVALLLIVFALFILWRACRGRKVLPQRSPVPRSPTQTVNGGVGSTAAEEQYYSRTAVKSIGGGGDGLVFVGKDDVECFKLQELLSASAETMGKGGTVGSTYKAYFESGIEVIVKRLKNVCVSELDFRAKMEELGSLHLIHPNIEPLRAYFYGREEKLLIYDPMPNGSLSALLHGYGKYNKFVSLEMRTRIAIGTASAIEYLHSISPTTTHGNIKSSNVFVGDDYEARVSEMGLTQLVSSIASLNGYLAPEVTDTRTITQKADVYSVGVVLLELLTGREPDRIMAEEGVVLPNWVQSVVEEKGTSAVIDQDLLSSEDQVVELLLLALSCTSRQPQARPSAADLTRRLHNICD